MVKVNLVCNDERWNNLPLEQMALTALKLIADKVLLKNFELEVSVLATNNSEISFLNKKFRNTDTATNILSWPERELRRPVGGQLPEYFLGRKNSLRESEFIGNLAISFERCSIEAKEGEIPLKDHILHLLIHGCLHLIGFDHENELDANFMEEIEARLLKDLRIKNPYEFTG